MSRASVLLSVRFRVMSLPEVVAVRVTVVPARVMLSPPSPISAWPLASKVSPLATASVPLEVVVMPERPRVMPEALVFPILMAAEPPVSRVRAPVPPERTVRAASVSLSAAVMTTVPRSFRVKVNWPSATSPMSRDSLAEPVISPPVTVKSPVKVPVPTAKVRKSVPVAFSKV